MERKKKADPKGKNEKKKKAPEAVAAHKTPEEESTIQEQHFPIVGIGASAGGIRKSDYVTYSFL